MSSSSSDEFDDIDADGIHPKKCRTRNGDYNLLNEKTKKLYETAYDNFRQWRENKNVTASESTILEYFELGSKKYKPKSLWAQYSMLKNTLRDREQIDISGFEAVTNFLKKLTQDYESKMDNVFSSKQVKKFLYEAPDNSYLLIKAVLIFSIVGGCRSTEIVNLRVEDIKEEGELILVKIPKTKGSKPHSFVINGDYTKIIRKYKSLRPENVVTDRFFLSFQHGRCQRKVIGKNKLATMAKDIATYLKLENPSSYTGHAFRRTFAALFGDPSKNILYL